MSDNTKRLVPSRASRFLKVIFIVLAVLAAVIVIYPLVPAVQYQVGLVRRADHLPSLQNAIPPIDNRLVIPKIGVDTQIVEGKTETTLYQGVWRVPSGSTPDQGSNTILTGHRFQYRPPNNTTFYLLDKLTAGDEVIVFWNQKKHEYRVTETKVVANNDFSIQAGTSDTRLTLYTCTPLFSTTKRLVVVASPI